MTLFCTFHAFFWPWGCWNLPLLWLSFGLRIVTVHQKLITVFRKSGKPFANASKSCVKSRQSYCCSCKSHLSANFTSTLLMPKSSVEVACAEHLLISILAVLGQSTDPSSFRINSSVTWMTAYWNTITILWSSDIFKSVTPFFNLL